MCGWRVRCENAEPFERGFRGPQFDALINDPQNVEPLF
jgi:hypothetical protein